MSEELFDFGEGAGSVELSLECANAQEVMFEPNNQVHSGNSLEIPSSKSTKEGVCSSTTSILV